VKRTVCAALLCTLALLACKDDDREPTEVIIEVHAEPQVGARSSTLRLQIESRNGEAQAPQLEYHPRVHWPFKLALTPRGGDAMRQYRVTAAAVDDQDNEEVIAAARIVSGFVAGERRRVRMVLEDACIGTRVCADPEETCHRREGAEAGACTNAYVDPARLGSGETPDLGDLLDDRPVPDAGSDDAGADGAVEDAGTTDGGGPLDPCGSDHGGCDPLGGCTRVDERAVCGPCPTGFAGDGDVGCEPRLIDLAVSPGELAPAFAAEETQYQVIVPLTRERVAITADAPAEANLAIEGEAVTSGQAWTAELAAGANALTVEVRASTGAQASYALAVNRGAQQAYVKAGNTGAGDHFGAAVAISGETLVIGAPGEDGPDPAIDSRQESGAAYVVVRDDDGWLQQDQLEADNAGKGDGFGQAVAISGDTLVIGAPLEDSSANAVGGDGASNAAPDAGAAYVFVRGAGGWAQQAYLKAHNARMYAMFGQSVAIDGDTIVVGAPYERSNETGVSGTGDDDSTPGRGAAYVFVREGTLWSQQAYLKSTHGGAEHLFGSAVAVGAESGTVAVGAPGDRADDNRGRGSAFVFTRSGVAWAPLAHVKSGAASPGEAFGHSVALSKDTLVVGTRPDDPMTQGMAAGAVHVFERADGFSNAQKLTASNRDPGDDFGHSVALESDLLLVGAPREAGSAFGIHAMAMDSDNAAVESGAAYVFVRTDAGWRSLAYLKASNADSSDGFGIAIGISSGTLVVGAIYESSEAQGVNAGPGAEADDSAMASGAAYVFH